MITRVHLCVAATAAWLALMFCVGAWMGESAKPPPGVACISPAGGYSTTSAENCNLYWSTLADMDTPSRTAPPPGEPTAAKPKLTIGDWFHFLLLFILD